MGICSFASLPGHIQVDFQRALLDFGVLSCIYQNVLKLAHWCIFFQLVGLKQNFNRLQRIYGQIASKRTTP